MQHYGFVLEGKTALLMHRDDVMAADAVAAWRRNPTNKRASVAGDDRSPAWSWISYLYHDPESGMIALDQQNIMTAIRSAATNVSLPKGRGSFKAISQYGLMIDQEYCEFLVKGKHVAMADVVALKDLPFADQFEAVKKLGFELSVKRARVGQAKHVRVRPMFRDWVVKGSLTVSEDALTATVIGQIFEICGRQTGLGDWRPSSKESPGQHGTFRAVVRPAKGKAD